jgi:hypothetical protein
MSQIENLLANYTRFIQLPWSTNLAGRQRVLFAVYPPSEERRLRAHIKEFEIATIDAKHDWYQVDITHTFAKWLAANDYKEAYFSEPGALATIEEELKSYVVNIIKSECQAEGVENETVIAVIGAGSLFGFTHISGIMAELEDSIRGRLLLFFPGEYERDVYRFMDARDGFNYMAVPITCAERLLY